ncbi:hypothetical protein LGV61_12460 [Desulfurispirillum indicum]|uniref:PssE/Cps14G family polysaccharide biosynthesis glycosyltransferase n=1 Tax=Desulfurispirillum indicum TaxID=936456 RepID=UPI001CFA2A4E|nr:PssE/Cps14G family polysaccharide biosynthesis glycosyltransferase [Desulfurispirillum indicum]UCZ56524.1 hypothetical protein LGV61_12460 [Desulfurispirillum indicum]
MILLTVGTTPFDSLVRYIDTNAPKNLNIQMQISNGDYKPSHFNFFSFNQNIHVLYEQASVVICHAGAGTVYKLLEMNKKIIVVPNLERADPHQRELAEFVGKNNYGFVCSDMPEVLTALAQIDSMTFNRYEKEIFFGADMLVDIIKKCYP